MRHNVKKLTLRLDAEEYTQLRELSQISGMKMEPLLRKLVMGETLHPRPPDTYAALLRELSAIGNNVNQLAHQANSRESATREEIHAASDLVGQAWRLVRETL